MRIALGGARLRVTEERANNRQAEARSGSHTGKAMAKVVDPDAGEFGGVTDLKPRSVETHQMVPWSLTWENKGVLFDTWKTMQNSQGRGIECDFFLACLTIG